MSATDDPTQGFGEAGDDPMSTGAPGEEHEDPSEGGEYGDDPSGGAPGHEHEDPSEGGSGDGGADPTAP
jgi:hypothetical protein